MELQGARAIVTGGASGIGAACVELLRASGARVVVFDLAESGDGVLIVDVSDETAVVDGVASAVAQLGGLDLAILSAGVGGSALSAWLVSSLPNSPIGRFRPRMDQANMPPMKVSLTGWRSSKVSTWGR